MTQMAGVVQPGVEKPYGRPYKIVMKMVGGPSITECMEPEAVGKVMDQLGHTLGRRAGATTVNGRRSRCCPSITERMEPEAVGKVMDQLGHTL